MKVSSRSTTAILNAYLKSANKSIINVFLEGLLSLSVFASPPPHIFGVAVLFAFIEYCSANGPHDDAEDKESNSEDSVVDCGLLRSPMASSPVRVQYTN